MGKAILSGEKVRLTNVTEADVEAIIGWHNDYEFKRLLSGSMPLFPAPSEIRGWMSKGTDMRHLRPFAIRTLAEDRLIGNCALKDIIWNAGTCSFWIGIGEPDARSQGFGTDAVRTLLRYAFLEANMQRVGLEVSEFNASAKRIYERLGFQLEGTRRRMLYLDGRHWDMYLMGMLREEWAALAQ